MKLIVSNIWTKKCIAMFAFTAVLLAGACSDKTQTPVPSGENTLPGVAGKPSVTDVGEKLFNDDWHFLRSDSVLSLDQASARTDWQAVSLPHTAKLEPLIVNDQWQGDAWYKKTIPYHSSWAEKKVFLHFEGAMNTAEVWLNGQKVGAHLGGYLPFNIELSSQLQNGDNVVMLRLDNRDNDITGPKPLAVLDFNMYGGIYRNVWLRVENPIHISDAIAAGKVASGGIFVRYPKVSQALAEVSVQTHIAHNGSAEAIEVAHTLRYKGVAVAQSSLTLTASSKLVDGVESTQLLRVTQPQLWSPSQPHLYALETRVIVGGQVVDSEQTRIGIREFTLVDNQLHINGEAIFLRGVNRHQEYPYIGYALSDAAQVRDAEKIKAAGFDYVRLSHYPHSKAFVRAADELGLVLLNAILGWQFVNDDPAFTEHALQTCRDLIRRDRNHASVLAWECSLNETNMGAELVQRLHQTVHEEYPGKNVYSAGWTAEDYDIYLQARQHRLGHYQEPTKPYAVSEYGDWEYYAMNAGLNQDSWGDLLQEQRSSRQLLSAGETRLQQQAANIQEAHNDNFTTTAFADSYWVMFDYNRGYADDLESSGIMSIHRLPKFSYYFYQSQRDGRDFAGPLHEGYMAHIASYWQQNSNLEFYVYSNADAVDLYLNGQLVAKGKPDLERYSKVAHPPFLFKLAKFSAGSLEAKAYVEGELVASHQVNTAGAATSLILTLEESSIAPQGGVNDVVFVYASLLDSRGNPVRLSGDEVCLTLTGDGQLLSPRCVQVEAGIASSLVRIGKAPGTIQIEATYGDSLSAQLDFQ